MAAIRKNPRMPPKPAPVPKKPKFPNYKVKAKPKVRPVARRCIGGPWDGQRVQVPNLSDDVTMVMRIGEFVGRYRWDYKIGLIWETV